MLPLVDTHTLLWSLYEPYKLPVQVKSLLAGGSTEVLISHVSVLEIVDKASKFRLPMAGNSPDSIMADIFALRGRLIGIELEDVLASAKLPLHHGDPLDRLLIAQAQRHGATLLSKDGKFKLYDVPVFWS